MGQLAQPSAERVVFAVVERVGEVIAATDGVFAMGWPVRFVGD